MRELLPLRQLIEEFKQKTNLKTPVTTTTRSTVFEDNNGCLALANAPAMSPRTKHIAIVYHWWRDHVERKHTDIVRVDTDEQLADTFTKPLTDDKFVYFRKLLLGW